MRLGLVAAGILAITACGGSPATPVIVPKAPADAPSLIVLLVADQMRTDYLDRGLPHFTGGLKRLATEGAWFRNAAYPYLNTITCAGHSTIGTGALPYRHGMVLNAWWDRATARSRACTADPDVKNIGYSGTPTGGDSAETLLSTTFADQLVAAGGRSVVMSLKPRSAITLAGRHPSSVVWFDDRAGWTTSSAFTATKQAWLAEFIEAHPVAGDRGWTWNRLLPEGEYSGADEGAGERSPAGWTTSFPHVLSAAGTGAFITQWQRSPLADEYLGRMAAHAVDALRLGRGTSTDFLAVSFSSLDLVGHQFGPASHEVQDVVLRLDRTIGTLLEHLDETVGRNRYVVAFGSDHGVGMLPEQSGGGRQTGDQVLAAINGALVPFFGPGKYGVFSAYTDVYLAPGVLDKLKRNDKASAAVLDAIRALPGVAHVFRADEIGAPETRTSADPVKRAAALSYYAPRSGDLIIVPKEHWMLSSTSATTHGTLYRYDQRVPLILLGPGVAPGTYDEPATPADIAPSLAALGRLRFAAPDGRPLVSALGRR